MASLCFYGEMHADKGFEFSGACSILLSYCNGSRAITHKQSLTFAGFLLAFFALDLLLLAWPESLMITGHEGDLMHMLDAALRMVDGERPHLDFMTPIGILGFAPVAGMLALGFPVGKATLLAGAGLLALMLPVIWWLGATRLSRGQAYYFAVVMVVTMMAVIYGSGSSAISLSMYYNRWGWSIAFLVLVTVLFKPQRMLGEGWVAPLVIGLGMAALAMLKVTFFAPLLPALVLILLAQKQGGLLLRALAVGVFTGVALLGWLGLDFFTAYLNDLLAVLRPESARANTGVSLQAIIAGPRTIITSFVLFAALLLFRKSGQMGQGLVVLILAPAFAYITYQNWGNDPKWLHLFVLYMWANLPSAEAKPVFRVPARQGALALIVAALTVIFPSLLTMATSPVRVAFVNTTEGFTKLRLNGGVSDIWLPEGRIADLYALQAVPGWPTLTPKLEPVTIADYTFPDCRLDPNTLVPQYLGMAQQIEALDGVRGRPVLVADVLNALWLIGDVGRVHGAAPWYYGDASGLSGAEYLAVPLCPSKPTLRAAMVARAQAGGYGLEEVQRTELMVLYALTKPAE